MWSNVFVCDYVNGPWAILNSEFQRMDSVKAKKSISDDLSISITDRSLS